MDVAVLGATGDVGRQVCTQLVEGPLADVEATVIEPPSG